MPRPPRDRVGCPGPRVRLSESFDTHRSCRRVPVDDLRRAGETADAHSSGLAIPAVILSCRSLFQKFLRWTLQGIDHLCAHPAIWIGAGE